MRTASHAGLRTSGNTSRYVNKLDRLEAAMDETHTKGNCRGCGCGPENHAKVQEVLKHFLKDLGRREGENDIRRSELVKKTRERGW